MISFEKNSDATRREWAQREWNTREEARRLAREDEMRREDETVVKLLGEERTILVLSHTKVQFDMFREKLDRARDGVCAGRARVIYVNRRYGQELWGHSSRSAVLVLLDDWEQTTDGEVRRLVWHLEGSRGIETFRT